MTTVRAVLAGGGAVLMAASGLVHSIVEGLAVPWHFAGWSRDSP